MYHLFSHGRWYHLMGIAGVVVGMLGFWGALGMGENSHTLSNLLPGDCEGWKVAESDREYTPATLYEYIDGGAELYLSYGFKKVLKRTYTKLGQPSIIVDIFDMGSSKNAFGVFSHSREVVDDTFGQGSQYTEGLMLFWKDRYYISLLSHPETVQSREAVFCLARKIDGAILTRGPLPEIIHLLPEVSLVKESVRYFRHYTWLNHHYFIADYNILNIDDRTDALLAKYRMKGAECILLLVSYKSNEDAESAHRKFRRHYLRVHSHELAIKMEDGSWTGCRLIGNLLIIVFGARSEGNVQSLMAAVEKKVQDEKRRTNVEKKSG